MHLISSDGEIISTSRVFMAGFIYLRETLNPGLYALVVANYEKKGGRTFIVTGGAAVGKLEVAKITT